MGSGVGPIKRIDGEEEEDSLLICNRVLNQMWVGTANPTLQALASGMYREDILGSV